MNLGKTTADSTYRESLSGIQAIWLLGKYKGKLSHFRHQQTLAGGVLTWGNRLEVGSRGGERGHSRVSETDGVIQALRGFLLGIVK